MQWDNDYLKRAYALKSSGDAKELYDEWATNYDTQLASAEYTSPAVAVDAIIAHLNARDVTKQPLSPLKILDAGCGTGLVGVLLSTRLAEQKLEATIDGLDLSPGMLDRARQTKVYGALSEADLSKPIEKPDDVYDVISCVGTLTQGHVGPEVLSEFVRVSKKGGLIVVTILSSIMEDGGYRSALGKLRTGTDTGLKIEVLQDEEFGVTKPTSEGARIIVLKKV